MSNIALHPTVINLRGIQQLERETGLCAVVQGFRRHPRAVLVPHTRAQHHPGLHVASGTNTEPTPPSAA